MGVSLVLIAEEHSGEVSGPTFIKGRARRLFKDTGSSQLTNVAQLHRHTRESTSVAIGTVNSVRVSTILRDTGCTCIIVSENVLPDLDLSRCKKTKVADYLGRVDLFPQVCIVEGEEEDQDCSITTFGSDENEGESKLPEISQSLTECEKSDVCCLLSSFPDVLSESPGCTSTESSNYGLGAVLLQYVDGYPYPLAYASRKLLDRERKYATIERECLAIVFRVQKFEYYLMGKEFILEVDHQPLIYRNKSKHANSRLTRWALALQPFRFRSTLAKTQDLPSSRAGRGGSLRTPGRVNSPTSPSYTAIPENRRVWRLVRTTRAPRLFKCGSGFRV
ncbi:hypothetical protein Pcinc_015095 [Petrolisthes cinctipes]|uniref:Reverse transcriptase RNase H-like domain-containing protein n=1 Tax=Petrolisthes cinctipes TaxID=88211 RepID=A0AAE1FWH1_PETCI|nr:hypothetical protein Pcinc_015095 [Petrolisthes cinctipes]